jgi:hypothetical protein
MRIAEATGNGALVAVVKMLWDERTGPLYKQLEHHYDSPALWGNAMAEHRAVVKAIGTGCERRTLAMQRHLNQAYKRFSTGWDSCTSATSRSQETTCLPAASTPRKTSASSRRRPRSRPGEGAVAPGCRADLRLGSALLLRGRNGSFVVASR